MACTTDAALAGPTCTHLPLPPFLPPQGHLLQPEEWRAYTRALATGSVAERMVLAARVAGDQTEARFWAHLPASLAAVKAMYDQQQVGGVGELGLLCELMHLVPLARVSCVVLLGVEGGSAGCCMMLRCGCQMVCAVGMGCGK